MYHLSVTTKCADLESFIREGPTLTTSFQRQLSIIDFTLNYPPIRNNLTSASLLSMLIDTDHLNYPPIRINLTSATHRTTGCFDDRLLTMMTDKGFYVP